VPFGNRELTGVVVATTHSSDVAPGKLREIVAIMDDQALIPPHLLDLWLWAARYYQHPVGEALHTLLPAGLRQQGKATVRNRKTDQEHCTPIRDSALILNSEQQSACDAIISSSGRFECFLLDGVTGSGKTEVYLQAIEHAISQHKQILVLVPEIGLTPQTLQRFRQRFTVEIAVMHSGLTARQRLNAWLQAKEGHATIVIGTRSAVFTPLARPGLIIIDEEHDNSFKQQDGFRYSARDLGIMRAREENIPVVLGSATPSLESLHNASSGRYRHLTLTVRAGSASLPKFILTDTSRQSLPDGLSDELLTAIKRHIDQGNQALVFINRRGFAPVLQCQDCGWVAECRHCDARLTIHRHPAHLRCHHCDRRHPVNPHCPVCQGKAMIAVGAGTERCETALQHHFPHTPIIRIDRDATRRKDDLNQLLAQIQQGQPSILVGTQMLAKGHHFPKVTLVGVLDADSGLFSADFRGQEFMAQLLLQVAGRAGRAEQAGEVLIQTRHSTHPSLQTLIHQGYHTLAEQLLQERKLSDMPPFTHLALIRAEAINAQDPQAFLSKARQIASSNLQRLAVSEADVSLMGPLPSPMEKRANRYRQQLLIKSSSRTALQQLLSTLCSELELVNNQRKVRWSIDVDPQDMV
jgi:primosomal protein N' (replication factor Y)